MSWPLHPPTAATRLQLFCNSLSGWTVLVPVSEWEVLRLQSPSGSIHSVYKNAKGKFRWDPKLRELFVKWESQ